MFKRLIVLIVAVVVLAMLGRIQDKKTERSPEVTEGSNVIVVSNTAYEEGCMAGHQAFLKQVGQYIPMPKSAKYSKDMGVDEQEEFNKGYVDGYHRAAESLHCPAGHSY